MNAMYFANNNIYKSVGVKTKHVRLTADTVELLYLVFQFQAVRMRSLFNMYNQYILNDDRRISYSAFRDRIVKLTKYNIIQRDAMRNVYSPNYQTIISLRPQGIKILKYFKYIKGNNSYSPAKVKTMKNKDHFFATQEIIFQTMIRNKTSGTIVESLPPYANIKNHPKTNQKIVIPDWMFSYKNEFTGTQRNIYLETDAGTMKKPQVFSKLKNYIRYAEVILDEEHIILFSIIDETFRGTRLFSQPFSRLITLKDYISNIYQQLPENLHFYILGYEQAKDSIHSFLLNGVGMIGKEDRIHHTIQQINHNKHIKRKWKLENDTINRSYKAPDYIVREKVGFRTYQSGLLFVREGDVHDYHRIMYLAHHYKDYNFYRLYVLYDSKEEMERDAISIKKNRKKIMFGNLEEIMDVEQPLRFYLSDGEHMEEILYD